MTYTIADEKFPKKPDEGPLLEACRKDFKNFRENSGLELEKHLNARILRLVQMKIDPKVVNAQKANITGIKKLIRAGQDEIAFSMFFRTFPACLPHRSRP
ncbi:MAG: hypothetical protein ACXAAI_01560 [Promethearchaeota archaeon]|jgi:hypothetical protein